MNFIETFHNALPDSVCDTIIKEFDSRDKYARKVQNAIRNDLSIQLGAHQSLLPLQGTVETYLSQCWQAYSDKYEVNNEFRDVISNAFKVQKSSTGGGFTFWHSEQGSDVRMISRIAVWMIYLNDNFEGGHTEFKFQQLSLKPEKGMCVIWPAAYTHLHRAAPDLVGDKYIITGWFRYPTPSIDYEPSSRH